MVGERTIEAIAKRAWCIDTADPMVSKKTYDRWWDEMKDEDAERYHQYMYNVRSVLTAAESIGYQVSLVEIADKKVRRAGGGSD